MNSAIYKAMIKIFILCRLPQQSHLLHPSKPAFVGTNSRQDWIRSGTSALDPGYLRES